MGWHGTLSVLLFAILILMSMTFYSINARPYAYNGSIEQELQMDPDKPYLFHLPHLSLVDMQGPRAFEFLQGQLSCDIRPVNSQRAVQGAQCNLKGRVLALMDVLDWQGCKIMVPDDLLEQSLNSLLKPAQLARIHLQKNTQVKIYGLYAPNPNAIELQTLTLTTKKGEVCSNESLCSYAFSPPFYFLIEKNHALTALKESLKSQDLVKEALAWHYLQLKNGHMQIYPLSRGLFLPHRLLLHSKGFISFDKGCYKGQEIIARTHYRAKLNYQLHQQILENTSDWVSGEDIELNHGGKGELIDFCPLSDHQTLGLISQVSKE